MAAAEPPPKPASDRLDCGGRINATRLMPLTTFVGRVGELARLNQLVKEFRLVTVMGPGGIGKTRLALELARAWPGETLLVDGAASRGLAELVRSVAAALAVSVEGVTGALAARGPLLLVVDNFEHLVDTASTQLHGWLAAAPELTMLVTSRRRTEVDGEATLVVPAMGVGVGVQADGDPSDSWPDGLALFVERARRVLPGLTRRLSETNGVDGNDGNRLRKTLHAIVARLEGVPLALELAAAQLRLMEPQQLLERLASMAQVLDVGGAAGRQDRTVRRAVEASWQTLDELQRKALSACSHFRGGFPLSAAEALLAGYERPPLILLGELVDRSLVYRTAAPEGSPRLAIFESIATFARGQLAGDESSRLDLRHAAWAAEFVTAQMPTAPGHAAVLPQQLSVERANLEHALNWLVGDCGVGINGTLSAERWLSLAGPVALGVAIVAEHVGPVTQAIEALSGVLERAVELGLVGQPSDLATCSMRAELAVELARVQLLFGDAGAAPMLLDTAEHDAKSLPTGELHGRLLVARAMQARLQRELDASEAFYRQAAEVFRVNGSPRLGRALSNLAALIMERGRFDDAQELFGEALKALKSAGDARLEAVTTGNHGLLQQELNAFDAAKESFEQALKLHAALGNRRFVGITYGDLAGLHAEARELEAASGAYRLGLAELRLAGDARHEALLLAALSACEARLGRRAAATEAAERSRELLADVTDATITDAAGVYLAGVLAPLGTDAEAAGSDDLADSDEVRLAARLMAQAGADRASHGQSLRVTAGATQLTLPGGGTVSLQTRPTLARVCEALVARRLSQGLALSIADLVRAAWPEQRAVTDAATNRVHVALSTLRTLGLKGLIVRDAGGYSIRADVPVVRVATTN